MAAVVLDTGAASRGSGNAGTTKEKTVRQWFVDHDLIESDLHLPKPSAARQIAPQGSPNGERGGANQNLLFSTTAPSIVMFLNQARSRGGGRRKGKLFLTNASQVFEKGDSRSVIPDSRIQCIAETLIGWKEEVTAWSDSAYSETEGHYWQDIRAAEDHRTYLSVYERCRD